MKSILTLLLFCVFYLAVHAQVNVPVFGKINYLKGYVKEIRGENIGYASVLPDFASTALLTRCTDGKYDIEWETEAVPANTRDEFVYFAWVAAHSKNTSHGERHFDLFVNDQKALTFTTYKEKKFPFWNFDGTNGVSTVFEWKMDDGAGDAHGYMYLKVPVSLLEKGKPARIRIVGQAEDSRDWYMTFKYEFAETIQVNPVSLVTIDDKQPLVVMATHFGKDAPLTVTVDGKDRYQFILKAGLNTFEIYYPVVKEPTIVKVEAIQKGMPAKTFNVTVKPVVYRDINLIHHAHYDVGYSHLQEEVVQIHNRNIANALRYIEQTRNYPEDAKFRWNIETTLAIENFMKIATPEQKEKLIKGIRDGYIGIGAFYANIMTGICQPEELFQLNSYARELELQYGIRIPAAMLGDIPGITWSSIPAMARTGIKYFSDGPNYVGAYPYDGDRVGNSNRNWKDRPFWWVSPSGEEKILFWMAGKGYSSWHGFKAGDIATERGKKRISAYMDELVASGYPYEMVQWRYNIVADNGPTDSLVSNFVKDWNSRYKSPHIRLNTVDRMFAEFEKRYGQQLPSFSGDMSPYWEDGAYSTAAEMAMNRVNSEQLTVLGKVYSILNAGNYPADLMNQAWKNVLLWDEHTWGAYNSISDPDLPFVVSQWEFKKAYALRADSLVKEIRKPLFKADNSKLPTEMDVVNPSSWDRSDVVYLDKETAALVKTVKDQNGKQLVSQTLSDGRMAVLVSVPALSAIRLQLVRDEQKVDIAFGNSEPNKLENKKLQLEFNSETGSISSLKIKSLGLELVNDSLYSGMDELLYVAGRNPSSAAVNKGTKISLVESGPVLTTIRTEGSAPGCNSFSREVTVFADLDKVEVTNMVDKKAIREKESLHFAFPFNIPASKMRFNTGWGGIFQPGSGQLEGANQDYYSINHWCDVSNQQYGVSLLVKEACLVEPGTMLDETPGKWGVKTWKVKPDTIPVIFSYVMNNYWHTNYKADQEGPVTFHYALLPHGIFSEAETERAGMAFNQPLIVVPAVGKQPAASLFTISNSNVIATSIVPERQGLRIRLFNAGGAPESFSIKWQQFQPTSIRISGEKEETKASPQTGELKIPAHGIMEIEVLKF
ncbi:MAG: glycoside hydrolase [Bacteroidales bacterium]|nr:glycoside hydrolase [Bacteroidales bacterium]